MNIYILIAGMAVGGAFWPLSVSAGQRPSVLFIHHSVGDSLLREGGVRHILREAGIDLWDQGYNNPGHGLKGPDGKPAGNYQIPDDNTDPDGFAALFTSKTNGKNTLGRIIAKHDIIVFKSCFPVSQISEDDPEKDKADTRRRSLANYRRHYFRIREGIDRFPEKKFIIMTQPPLHPNATTPEEAQRARSLAAWLRSDEFLDGRRHLLVFDYFGLLADEKTHALRAEYQMEPQGNNSHPNPIAQMLLGPQFADFIINSVRIGTHADPPRVSFDGMRAMNRIPGSPVQLSGRIDSPGGIKRVFWTDFRRGGELTANGFWEIRDLALRPGITKVMVTAVDSRGLQASSIAGLQYYPGAAKEAVIFDGKLRKGTLRGITLVDHPRGTGSRNLMVRGDGSRQRVVIGGIDLDVSAFDPATSYLEISYDQGADTAEPQFLIPGVVVLPLHVDHTPGFEKVIVPLSKYCFINNVLDNIVLKAAWSKGTSVYIDSIRIVSIGTQ